MAQGVSEAEYEKAWDYFRARGRYWLLLSAVVSWCMVFFVLSTQFALLRGHDFTTTTVLLMFVTFGLIAYGKWIVLMLFDRKYREACSALWVKKTEVARIVASRRKSLGLMLGLVVIPFVLMMLRILSDSLAINNALGGTLIGYFVIVFLGYGLYCVRYAWQGFVLTKSETYRDEIRPMGALQTIWIGAIYTLAILGLFASYRAWSISRVRPNEFNMLAAALVGDAWRSDTGGEYHGVVTINPDGTLYRWQNDPAGVYHVEVYKSGQLHTGKLQDGAVTLREDFQPGSTDINWFNFFFLPDSSLYPKEPED